MQKDATIIYDNQLSECKVRICYERFSSESNSNNVQQLSAQALIEQLDPRHQEEILCLLKPFLHFVCSH